MNASIQIINEQGYDQLSIRKIAELIAYSSTTIYLYYDNKPQIAEDIGKSISKKMVADISEILANQKSLSVKEKLGQSVKQFLMIMTSYSEMEKAFIRSDSSTFFQKTTADKTDQNPCIFYLLKDMHKQLLKKSMLS